jgi:hypothetical protein
MSSLVSIALSRRHLAHLGQGRMAEGLFGTARLDCGMSCFFWLIGSYPTGFSSRKTASAIEIQVTIRRHFFALLSR